MKGDVMEPWRIERFWAYVDKTDGCWLWTAGLTGSGYGGFFTGERTTVAHRVSYELLVGPIPEGLQLDHLCRTRRCVNPEHLEPVTARENLMRGQGAAALNNRKTHCKHGHPFDAENTAIKRDGSRYCRECYRRYFRKWWHEKRATA